MQPNLIRNLFWLFWIPLLLFAGFSCSSKNPTVVNYGVELPAGWHLSVYNAHIDLIKAEEDKKKYAIQFDRSTQNKEEAYYLKIAEAVFPDRRQIFGPDFKEKDQTIKNWYFERLWWHETYKDRNIPFSITGDAINFYIETYKEIKKIIQKSPSETLWSTGNQNRVEFFYEAKVFMPFSGLDAKGDASGDSQGENRELTGPVRVLMKIRWFEFCGQPCGWGFEKEREVVFESRNKIIEIRGDGPTKKWVSSKETPYAPHQWISF